MPDEPQENQEGQENPAQSSGKKVELPEELFVIMILIGAWVIELVALATGAGIIISESINVILGVALEAYIWLRGGKGALQLVTPIVGILVEMSVLVPGKMITLLIVYYLMNHLKITQAVDKLAHVAGKMAR